MLQFNCKVSGTGKGNTKLKEYKQWVYSRFKEQEILQHKHMVFF